MKDVVLGVGQWNRIKILFSSTVMPKARIGGSL
jgi:hypothetical protein